MNHMNTQIKYFNEVTENALSHLFMASCNNEGLREESCTKENNEYDSLI